MTTDHLTRLRALPEPSAALIAYTAALDAFTIENAPGEWRPYAGRIQAKDALDEAWQALPYSDKQRARACGGGER